MKISLIAPSELDAGLIAQWQAIQRHDPGLCSPYYAPGFTQWVAQCGRDVRVAVLESEGQVVGFFPHELATWGRLLPVGGGLNDYHGAIIKAGQLVDAGTLIRACGARYFGFNHLPRAQSCFAPHIAFDHVSPVMELQGGFAAYLQRLATVQNQGQPSTATPGIVASVKKSSKRIERDLGPLRFEMHERSMAVLETLMRLKTAQRARTVGLADDPFALPWVRQLMVKCVEQQVSGHSNDFGGAMCALYAGDTLVACHVGLQNGPVLHGWFSIYDPVHAYYQPALIMYLRLAQDGHLDGLERFDMGRGTQDYKMRFATDFVPLGEGAVSVPALVAGTVMAAKQAKRQLKANAQVQRLRAWIAKTKVAIKPPPAAP